MRRSAMLPFSRRARGRMAVLVGVTGLGLVLSALPAAVPEASAAPVAPAPAAAPQPWVAPTGEDPVRPDIVSATVTAHASGQRVEVLSERTETSRTWALPEGGFTSETSAAPVRFPDKGADHDGWTDIDTTLVVKADGSVAPKAVPESVELAGAGDPASQLITRTDVGQVLTLGAGVDRLLPAPVLDGSTATYPDVLPGVDVQVEVRPTGFEQLWVAKTRAGLDQLLTEQAGGDQGVAAAMNLDDLTAKSQADGGVTFTDTDNKVVSRMAPPTVWDAVTLPDGEPKHEAAADLDVVDGSAVVPDKTAATGDLDLSVVPDQAWLDDPARQFPVTIDPTYLSTTASPIFDTWLQESNTSDLSTSTALPVGMGSNGLKNRSFLNFDTSPFKYKVITSASLNLWEANSATCTSSGWSSYNSGTASTSSRWATPPTISTKYATSTDTKGFSASCAAGPVKIDMKAQLQAWADPAAPGTQGMALKADDETSSAAGYHLFNSSEAGANPPVLTYSYSRQPGTPSVTQLPQTTLYKPSGSSTSYLYSPTTRPTVSATLASDPDGDVIRGRFYAMPNATSLDTTTRTSYCSNNTYLASGSAVSCQLVDPLTANTSYWMRGAEQDSPGLNSGYSAAQEIRIASVTPAAPVISCPGYANNSWTVTAPTADLTCTVSAVGTGYSAPSAIKYSVDGAAPTTTPITQSSSAATAKTTSSVRAYTGGHTIEAYAVNPAGLTSTKAMWAAGWSTPSINQPHYGTTTTTTDTVPLALTGPPRNAGSPLPTATVYWRVAGSTSATGGFVAAPAGTSWAVADSGGGIKATTNFDTGLLVGQTDGAGLPVGDRTSTLVEIKVALGYDTGAQYTGRVTVNRVPHAFGDSFPQADAGPGQVALWTGELSVSDTDADLATPDGSLSVSRSHTSFAGQPAVQNRVFGPGWAASFDGDGSGSGGAELWDNTWADGTLAVADSDGSQLLYATPGTTPGSRRTTAALPTGTYVPANDDTIEAGTTLTVSGSGAATVAELTSDDGVVTKFIVTAAPIANAGATFRTAEVREPAVPGKTTYSYDSSGRVTAITAALPDGVTTCTPGTATAGCRVLKISYATATTATATTPGDYVGQVKQITAQVNTDTDKPLTTYKYDPSGLLLTVTGVRTNLTTAYTYTGTGTSLRLATLTPPGQAAYTFAYSGNKLAKVTRPNPTAAGGGTAQLAAYVYGVPLAGTVTGLPDMTTEVDKWNQDRDPTWAAAVFGQDKPITAAPAANSPDWQYADLQFTDAQGYTLNTASYGAGDWQLTATDYDDRGNPIREWDERAIGGIRDGSVAGGGASDDVATLTVYNDDITSGSTVVTPAGTLVTDTYGPVHQVAAADGTPQPLRSHTKTSYDQGAPNSGVNPETSQPYRLPTKTVSTAESVDGTTDGSTPLSITLTGYEPIVTGDTSGWALGKVTTSTVDMDSSGTVTAGDITTKTRYDSRGRIIEDRQPKSSGSDAGTRVTTYYTGGTSSVNGCGSKPEWAGRICQVGPAYQPAGQTLPTTKTTGYTWDLQATTETDTSGAVTSTTTTSYDAQDRSTTVTTATTGLSGSTAMPATTTNYEFTTGYVAGSTSTLGSTATNYDNWGRQISYTNTPAGQTADTSTTTYDTSGRVTTVVDNNGQTAYTYDGTDAAGKSERRGQLTTVKVKTTNGTEYTSTGAYDDNGDLTLEQLPGNLTRRTDTDVAGDQTDLTVNGQGINPDTGNLDPDQPWLAWTTTRNAQSQIVAEDTPAGTAGTDDADHTYSYDKAGRLTTVHDHTGNLAATGTTPCTTRTYSFDASGNRTGQNTYAAATDNSCTTTGGSPITRAYDTADRPTTGANGTGTYTYDQLGRQTKIPASDTSTPSAGDITLGYYDNDKIHSVTQNGTSTTLILDGGGRFLTQASSTGGTTTRSLVRHYTDNGDSPTWSVDTGGNTNTTTRYNKLLDGNLGLTLMNAGTTTGAQLELNTSRGDTATTVTLPAGGTGPGGAPAVGVDAWNTFEEYGNAQQSVSSSPGGVAGIGYGWLGAKQRSTLPQGLILMGARLYNSTTGLFTSVDPVYRGNATAYGYPLDPINSSDVSGQKKESYRHKLLRTAVEAAVCSAMGVVGCGLVGVISGLAKKRAKKIDDGDDSYQNRSNAVRHFIWQGLLMRTFGYGWAQAVGDSHEWGLANLGGRTGADSRRDQQNNVTTRTYILLNYPLKYKLRSVKWLNKWSKKYYTLGNDLYDRGYFTRLY